MVDLRNTMRTADATDMECGMLSVARGPVTDRMTVCLLWRKERTEGSIAVLLGAGVTEVLSDMECGVLSVARGPVTDRPTVCLLWRK
jgi:hypothetical protein